MKQEQILTTLYDMALVIGAEDELKPLIRNTLMRLAYQTGYPVGLFLLGDTPPCDEPLQSCSLELAAAIGDHRLNSFAGQQLSFPPSLICDEALQFPTDASQLEQLPLRQDYYKCALRLPIPGEGIILLLSPEPVNPDIPFAQIFQPIMANLAMAIALCRTHEAYTANLISDRDEARSTLQRFRSALDTSNDCIFLIEPHEMRFIDFNETAIEVLEYSRDELLAMGPHDIKPDYDRQSLQDYFDQLQGSSHGVYGEIETDHQKKSGESFPVEIRLSVLQLGGEKPLLIAVARDITERKQAEEVKERAQVTLDSIGDGVITTDPQGYVEYLNPIAESLTGWSNQEAKHLPLSRIFRVVDETTHEVMSNPVVQCINENHIIGMAGHTLLINRFGDEIPIEDSAAPIRNTVGEITGVVLVFHDVSKAREMAHELSWQASHDSLTGLINRREFEYRLDKAFELTKETGTIHTMLYIDLDQFKLVNDTCGHVAGDELLRQLTSHLQQLVRENDTLARLGGDEFGVLLEHCELDQARRVANAVRDCIMEYTFSWEEKSFKVGSSIGIVEINPLLNNTAEIMSNADVACYVAKEHGGNRSHLFQSDDTELAQRQGEMRWVSRINDALDNKRLTLYCQAIHSLDSGDEIAPHYELLLRMVDKDGELISPGSFIPAAERYKLMYEIDCWVIRQAFSEFTKHQGQAVQPIFTINLSGLSLTHDDLFAYIQEQFRLSGAPPENFCFEVTETAAISNLSRAHDLILALKSLGCTFALDDFGSGLSSFTYLKNLPVDYLKIDGSFVKDILDDPIDESMVIAINQIGHRMGLKTIAEFVESKATREKLQEIGVDYAQGYALDKPIPLDTLYSSMSASSRAIITASSRPLSPG